MLLALLLAVGLTQTPDCRTLPAPVPPLPFAQGEVLEFSIDALGIPAGAMTLRLLPQRSDGSWVVESRSQAKSLAASIKELELLILTTFDPSKVSPTNTREDISDGVQRVYFSATYSPERKVSVRQVQDNVEPKVKELTHGGGITDGALGLYRLRAIPLAKGDALCTDVYGFGQLWRVTAKVAGRERVTTPLGNFEAWHIIGTSKTLLEKSKKTEGPIEVHLWLGTDQRRLPLAALAVGKKGVGRMTLKSYTQGSATPGSIAPAATREAQ